MKTSGDDGNAAAAPDLAETQTDSQGVGMAQSGSYGSSAWLSAEQQMPILTPSSGSMYDKNGSGSGHMSGFGDVNVDNHESSGSPEGAQSNGRTPNSSIGAGSEARSQFPPGQLGGTGQDSFRTDPLSPQQNVMNHGNVGAVNHHGYYNDPNGFAMSTGMTGQQGGFGMSNNWGGGMGGQPQIQPVGEGVLRALMSMGPMDAMDLSSWDSGNDSTMR